MKVLVTGGVGFIGSEIVKQLRDKTEAEIVVLDALTKQIHGEDPEKSYLYSAIKNKCKFVHGDIRDYSVVKTALSGCNYVIHLAAETGTGQSMYEINQYNEVNIMGTSNLLQAILSEHQHINKFILASSRSVYGEGKYECPDHGTTFPEGRKVEKMREKDFSMHCPYCGKTMKVIATDEESKIAPNSLYAFTKYSQEKMVETMCRAMSIDYTIFRFQNVYGAGQSLKNPYTGILSIFSTLMLANKPINIFEDGNESRDFIHVRDIAASVITALSKAQTNSEIINLGSGQEKSVIEIADMLRNEYHSQSTIEISGDFRIGDIAHNFADITKAKKLFDFTPRVSLAEGLHEFCEWVKKQEALDSGYYQSLSEMENTGMFIRTGSH